MWEFEILNPRLFKSEGKFYVLLLYQQNIKFAIYKERRCLVFAWKISKLVGTIQAAS